MDHSQSIDDRLRNIETLLLSQKTVLNFDEVAGYTGLSKSYLYKLTSNGGVPCYKPQGKVYLFQQTGNRPMVNAKQESHHQRARQSGSPPFVT